MIGKDEGTNMLTTKETAELLGISVRRVTSLIESGALSAQKFGRSWMIDEASVHLRARKEHHPGRPSSRENPHTGRFVLMNRHRPVAGFTYHFQTGEVSHIEPLEDIAWKPFGIGRHEKSPNRYDFAEWIRHRTIPGMRPNLPLALRHLNVASSAVLMFEAWGLSLSDPYWFKPEGEDIDWADINYFDSGYEEAFGNLMLSGSLNSSELGGKSCIDKPAITHSPDTATNGMLQKTWIRRGGKDYLIKGGLGNENREPFNEKLACKLLERLLEPDEFVSYSVVERNGRSYSSCENMVSCETELIPAADVMTAFAISGGRDLHTYYLRALRELAVPNAQQLIDKMIVVDHLMANFDRHTYNFGLIRNAETLDNYRVAPLFDHGCGFYARATTVELERGPYFWESHPFCEYPSQQLALVQDLTWYDPSALDGFTDDIAEVLGENPEIDERFIAAVQRQVEYQIATVNRLAAERGLIVAGW
jgi:excisionase family DNA binding protein